MNTSRKSALVTGAAGFIGHHLVSRLLSEGWSVAAMDDFSTGPRSNLDQHSGNPAFRIFEGDIRDAKFVSASLQEFKPTVLFHLAAVHFIPLCDSNPAGTLSVNVVGTQTLVDNLPEGTPRFIFASTGDVYVPSDTPHAETDPLGSLNIYGISKQMCEELIRFAAKKRKDTRFTILRLFNAFGPGETNPHVLPDIQRGLRQGGALRLGNLTPLRDYVFVLDIVDAMVLAATYDGTEQTMNVGTGEGRSVRQLLDVLEKVVGRSISTQQDPARIRPIERQVLMANATRAAKELGWKPRTPLEKGLRELMSAESV